MEFSFLITIFNLILSCGIKKSKTYYLENIFLDILIGRCGLHNGLVGTKICSIGLGADRPACWNKKLRLGSCRRTLCSVKSFLHLNISSHILIYVHFQLKLYIEN